MTTDGNLPRSSVALAALAALALLAAGLPVDVDALTRAPARIVSLEAPTLREGALAIVVGPAGAEQRRDGGNLELGIEQRRRQREPRGHPLENGGQRRTVRLTGGQKA